MVIVICVKEPFFFSCNPNPSTLMGSEQFLHSFNFVTAATGYKEHSTNFGFLSILSVTDVLS